MRTGIRHAVVIGLGVIALSLPLKLVAVVARSTFIASYCMLMFMAADQLSAAGAGPPVLVGWISTSAEMPSRSCRRRIGIDSYSTFGTI